MKQFNLVIFVPVDHTEEVLKAIGDAGAGKIGDYTHCSNVSRSQGRFLPGENADPEIGESGEFQTAEENRIETTCDEGNMKKVVDALKKAHPYEEVSYYLFERIVL